jgi:hypothetical protein
LQPVGCRKGAAEQRMTSGFQTVFYTIMGIINEFVVNCRARESTTKKMNRNNTNIATGNEPEFRTNY